MIARTPARPLHTLMQRVQTIPAWATTCGQMQSPRQPANDGSWPKPQFAPKLHKVSTFHADRTQD